MIDRFCKVCRETVTPEQVECPFCGQDTAPVDERWGGREAATNLGKDDWKFALASFAVIVAVFGMVLS